MIYLNIPQHHVTNVFCIPRVIHMETVFNVLLQKLCLNFVYKRNITSDLKKLMYVVGSKSFRPDQLFKVTEIKQLYYFST